jgi:tetratricopeptide (TPR) repeat protein
VSGPEFADHPGRVSVLALTALLACDDEARQALLEDAAAIATRIGDEDGVARIAFIRGEFRLAFFHDGPGARSDFESALAIMDRRKMPDGVGWCHDHLGWAAIADGDYDGARGHFELALTLARSDPLGQYLEPHALGALAALIARAGDADQAARLAEEAVSTARRLPARPLLAMALSRAAEAAVLAGQHRRAAAILDEFFGVIADLGTRRFLADALESAAMVVEGDDDGEVAAELLGAADGLRRADDEPSGSLRVSAPEVEQTRARLEAALGTDRLSEHDARGRALSVEAAIARAVTGLTRGD